MKTIHISIEGITPLICNAFTDEAAAAATNGTRASAVGSKGTPREQAEAKLYRGSDGESLIIPQPNLFRCVMDGGIFFKNGKSKVTTQKSSLIPACVDLYGLSNQAEIQITSREGWRVDTRAVRIPSTGGRILCHRPMFDDWRLDFGIDLDEEVITEKLLREIIDASAKRIGLGDFRPSCKGPFGKFTVVKWEPQEVLRAA